MASAEFQSLGELFECPVCMEKYRDPRILQCGHHFCLICLEDIYRSKGDGQVACPTCRHVSVVEREEGVKGLPRPVAMNELQEKIAGYLEQGDGSSPALYPRLPENTSRTEQESSRTQQHGALGTDSINVLDPVNDPCPVHPSRPITLYCEACQTLICAGCFLSEHEGHQVKDVASVAAEARTRLGHVIRVQDVDHDDEIYIALVKAKIHHVMEIQSKLKTFTRDMRNLLRETGEKLDSMEEDANLKLTAEVKSMTLIESDASDVLSSKRSLLDYGRHLVERASDVEIVRNAGSFPEFPGKVTRRAQYASVPINMAEVESLVPRILDIQRHLFLDYRRENIGELGPLLPEDACQGETPPVRQVHRLERVEVRWTLRGLAVDTQHQRIIARTGDDAGPVKLYDYHGTSRETLGADLELVDKENRGIAFDSRRDLYLIPVRRALKRVTLEGKLDSERRVPKHIAGIAYSRTNDVYIFSASHKIFLTDAETFQPVTTFKPKVTFNHPWNVTCGVVSGVCSNKPVIAVSESGGYCVKVLNFTGEHLLTFGGPGTLNQPWGLCPGPGARLLVADQYNSRVHALWRDGEQEQGVVLAGKAEGIKKRPLFVTCDSLQNIIVVGLTNNNIIFYKGFS